MGDSYITISVSTSYALSVQILQELGIYMFDISDDLLCIIVDSQEDRPVPEPRHGGKQFSADYCL